VSSKKQRVAPRVPPVFRPAPKTSPAREVLGIGSAKTDGHKETEASTVSPVERRDPVNMVRPDAYPADAATKNRPAAEMAQLNVRLPRRLILAIQREQLRRKEIGAPRAKCSQQAIVQEILEAALVR